MLNLLNGYQSIDYRDEDLYEGHNSDCPCPDCHETHDAFKEHEWCRDCQDVVDTMIAKGEICQHLTEIPWGGGTENVCDSCQAFYNWKVQYGLWF